MKLICRQSDLSSGLSLVSRAVSSRPTHPVLGNVLLEADADHNYLRLTAFDLSLGIQSSFTADVQQGGRITLPAKLLNDIVSRLPDGDITLVIDPDSEAGDSHLTTITSESGRFQIRGLDADDFPALPTVQGVKPLLLPVATLNEGLRGALFAASTDETKQVLTGVHIKGSSDSLEFAATDGHRLAVVEAPTQIENDEGEAVVTGSDLADFAVTIPARALRELERMVASQGNSDLVSLVVNDTQVIFELGNQRLTSRKLEGAYPAYGQLIPRQFSRTVTMDRKRLISALERVSVLADQKNNLVTFTLQTPTNQLQLAVEAQDLGHGEESMGAEIIGEGGQIAFNIKYLMDGLKALPSNDIQMQLNEGNQPVIFTPLGGLKMTYLVMPVRLVN
ncbi:MULTISPECIES: DNA polymerase III subunit beta [unclassified Synechocystis]|uniref:DNA polymerase III subunit beta n=1 Tax=unclassified Synechocystis TaxID=2640012 RepID=UPI0003F5697F|nr:MULTISPECIES: DNA polymerase III subunit beta [unclassified Synechocystis]AIE74466.1 DNA polymerase III beta subunit [Synechocystis sp. PCC 6714]MCT0254771.1 DNA polymerase III subunit beta [Synechocystis sp. CS-94]